MNPAQYAWAVNASVVFEALVSENQIRGSRKSLAQIRGWVGAGGFSSIPDIVITAGRRTLYAPILHQN
jgi:hypothetical protein